MRMILIVPLMIFLSSCQQIPILKQPFERCVIYLEQLGEDTYSGKCRCHQYEITPDNIGRISDSIDKPLNYCDRFVALKASGSWTDLRSWFGDLMFLYNQNRDKIERAKKKAR